jgi:hypothetical protein
VLGALGVAASALPLWALLAVALIVLVTSTAVGFWGVRAEDRPALRR